MKILGDLTSDTIPVIESPKYKEETVVSCKDFKGKLSSITGIIAKGLYIGKINEQGEPEIPTVRIVCGEECKEKCINLTNSIKDDKSGSIST